MPRSLRRLLAVSGEPGKLDAILNSKALRKVWFSASLTKMVSSSLIDARPTRNCTIRNFITFKKSFRPPLAVVNGTPIVLAALHAE